MGTVKKQREFWLARMSKIPKILKKTQVHGIGAKNKKNSLTVPPPHSHLRIPRTSFRPFEKNS